MITVIKATPLDIAALKQISIQTFTETFAAQNTRENMQLFTATAFAHEVLLNELNCSQSAFYFAKEADTVVGYLKVNTGQAQTELQTENSLEIERIYVLKAHQGKKWGKLLFNHAISLAKAKQATYLWLGVWEKNSKAIAFYEKNGLVKFATHVFNLGNDAQTDVLMRLLLK